MPAHTHAHTTPAIRAPTLHEHMRAHTSALHLHGRRTYAGLLCRLPSHLMLSCSPLDGRVAPRRAAAARRRPVAAAPLSPPREAPLPAAAAAAAAELLGSTPTMAAAADKEPVRVERETPMTAPPPAPGPGVGRSVVDVGREQRAGRRARRVGGVPTSAADGTRAQKPWRMVRDDSPSSRTDHPAHAWAVRGLDVTGSEHHDEEKHGRVGGTAGACGTVGSQN
jgi:hypothetical protein